MSGFDVMEEEEFGDDIQELIDSLVIEKSGYSEDTPEVFAPKSRLEARKWVLAYVKIKGEQEWLKDEYLPHLMQKYIDPQKSKIERMKNEQEALLSGLKYYLEKNEEGKKVNYPDLGTVSIREIPAKIMYPEDEESFAKILAENGEDKYISIAYKLDKKKIGQEFKDTGQSPLEGLSIIDKDFTASVRRTSVKKDA